MTYHNLECAAVGQTGSSKGTPWRSVRKAAGLRTISCTAGEFQLQLGLHAFNAFEYGSKKGLLNFG